MAKWMACLAALFVWAAPTTYAQRAEDLRQQLEQLKQEYEQKLQDLEQRIAALEKQGSQRPVPTQTTPQQSAPSDLGQAVGEGVKTVILGQAQTAQGQLPSEPSYDQLQEARSKISDLEREAKAFEFHGYLRSGYGLNSEGGQQVAFHAQGAGAKFRLGNEAETYGELIFVNNWTNPQHDPDQPWIKTEVMLESDTTNSSNYANNDKFRLRESFVQIGNVFKTQPNAKFWAGQRYYRRQHIDIDDLYPLDMSGYGGGVEDVNFKFGKAAVAFLAGARDDIVTNAGDYAKSNVDVRLYDIKAPLGQVGFWFDYAVAKGGTTQQLLAFPTAMGYAFGFTHKRLEWEGGYAQFGIQYGKGAASNFSSSLDNPSPYLRKSDRFLVTEQVVVQPNKKFAIMPIAVYQRVKDGNPLHGTDRWLSFGARPQIFFTEHLSLAFEGGFDRVWSGQQLYDGWLRKVTIAPQLGAGREFFSRPVLRLFLTYGNWSEGLRGYAGGIPYASKTAGLTYGVQAETWW
jgi:maltoporin